MANNVVLKSIELTSTWTAISSESLVADITIVVVAGSSQFINTSAEIRCGAITILLPLSQRFRLSGVDLSTVEVRSSYTDLRLTAIGNTR